MRRPEVVLGPTTKGFVLDEPLTAAAYVAQGHALFDGSLGRPVMTLDHAALDHDVATLARFAADHGLELAPHGKTTMSPELWARQLDAGAWGITVATPHQARTAHALGVRRLLVANEVVDPVALRWAATAAADPDVEVLLYVDSVAGVEAVEAALAGTDAGPLTVLLEVGHAAGRTGVRTHEEAVAVAERAVASDAVRLVGVSGYEGGLPDDARVRSFLAGLRDTAHDLAERALLPPDGIVLSAGGSAWFDVVADVLGRDPDGTGPLPGYGTRTLLRSGSYVTHDHGTYAHRTPYTRLAGHLLPAIRVWAQVLSTPEPGLALLDAGKRDVPYDEGLPVPLRRHRPGVEAVDVRGWTLTRTNDQHAYLDHDPHHDAGAGDPTDLAVGDVVELGVSHPCTAFDKWRAVPVLDADLRVVDVVSTWF